MVVISNYLINNPYKLTSLNTFAEKYELLNHRFQRTSWLSSVPLRKSKSVIFRLWLEQVVALFLHHQSQAMKPKKWCRLAWQTFRKRPYLARWLYLPVWFAQHTCHFEKYWAHHCQELYGPKKIDAVMTVATKGVPLQMQLPMSSMFHLSLCAVIWKITEGSTVSVNYVSGSSGDRIEKMFFQNAVSRQAVVSWSWMTFERRRNGQRDD